MLIFYGFYQIRPYFLIAETVIEKKESDQPTDENDDLPRTKNSEDSRKRRRSHNVTSYEDPPGLSDEDDEQPLAQKPSSRSKRTRKVPKKFQDSDFESPDENLDNEDDDFVGELSEEDIPIKKVSKPKRSRIRSKSKTDNSSYAELSGMN